MYLIFFGSLAFLISFYYSGLQLFFSRRLFQQKNDTQSTPINITNNIKPKECPFSTATTLFKSTCSAAADGRGPHQNVIAYSMFGSNFSEPKFYDLYLKTFSETLRTIPAKYPGTFLRLHNAVKVEMNYFRNFKSWLVKVYKNITFV
jgi:hypothetical protein